MNLVYCGRDMDMNIGNGKTVSAIKSVLDEYMYKNKTIYSNIVLSHVDYVQLTPDNIFQCLDEGEHSVFLLDEIHAILYKNHRISVTCKQHTELGLCYTLTQIFRQVRKRDVTTISTAQSFSDCHFQLRQLMQEQIVCEKYYILDDGTISKCNFDKCLHDLHLIKQTNLRTNQVSYFKPEKYYKYYNSNELVKGWV